MAVAHFAGRTHLAGISISMMTSIGMMQNSSDSFEQEKHAKRTCGHLHRAPRAIFAPHAWKEKWPGSLLKSLLPLNTYPRHLPVPKVR